MMRQIAVSGTAPTPLGKQVGGMLLPFWSDIEALFYLGTDYHAGAPSAGAPYTDLTGHGHTLARVGADANAGPKAKHFVGNGFNYLTTSFTGEYLADTVGKPGELAMMVWAIAPPTESSNLVTNEVGAGGFSNKYVSLKATPAADVFGIFHDTVEADTPGFGNPVDADRATKYRSFMAAFRKEDVLLGYEMAGTKERSFLEYRNDNIGVGSDIGGNIFWIGHSGVGTYNLKIAAVAFLNRFPTPGKCKTLDAATRRQLGGYGLSFV